METSKLVEALRAINIPFGNYEALMKMAADVIESLDRRVSALEARSPAAKPRVTVENNTVD